MKYYVNKKTMMLGSDDKTNWLNLPEPPDWMDGNASARLETIISDNFCTDLHTIEYDDQTDVCLEIDFSGNNFLSSMEENPAIQTILDLFNELVDREEASSDEL